MMLVLEGSENFLLSADFLFDFTENLVVLLEQGWELLSQLLGVNAFDIIKINTLRSRLFHKSLNLSSASKRKQGR